MSPAHPEPARAVPLCKACRWCVVEEADTALGMVMARFCDNAPIDVITGPPGLCRAERAPLTMWERMFGTPRCGPQGLHFEPLEPAE